LKYALAKNITRHASLCYSITGESPSSEAQLVRLETLNWNEVVEFRKVYSPAGKYDVVLAARLGQEHERLWSNPGKPIWRLIVFEYEDTAMNPGFERVVDMAFISHHAIVDGISASAFHKSLLLFLQEACTLQNLESDWPLIIPRHIFKPQHLEDFMNYTPKSNSLITGSPPSSSAWTASPPSLPSIWDYKSRVHIITVPIGKLPSILNSCRRLQTTITGLLHSFIVIKLSKLVQKAQGFKAVTPYSMRRFTGVPSTEIANHISYITSSWPASLLGRARSCSPNTSDEDEIITSISQQYKSEISDELGRVSTHGPQMLNNVSAINNFTDYCKGLTDSRSHTYELSNIGVVTLPTPPEPVNIKLDKLVFTQCGMVAGPAIGFGVVSLAGGPLVVSIYWQEGILEEELMEELRCSLEERLLAFAG